MDKPIPVSFIQPCPPHQWSHAPTVGYFSCVKCRERVEHSDPRYADLLAERDSAVAKAMDKPMNKDGMTGVLGDRFAATQRHVRWQQWGFEPGYSIRHRVAFTKSVAGRLQEKGRGERVRFLGIPLWTTRLTDEWCADHADILVTDFLKMEAVKFGHPDYDWRDGGDIADEDMANWERI